MTQRLQGCETIEDVIKVAERFAPNIAPTIPGKLYVLDTDPAAALRSAVAVARRRDDALFSRRLLGDTAGTQPSAGAGRARYHLLSSAGDARRPVALRTAHRPKPLAC